jgi:hypothetical protein
MNGGGHKLLSPVLFGHLSDSSASAEAPDVQYKPLYTNFVERLGDGCSRI